MPHKHLVAAQDAQKQGSEGQPGGGRAAEVVEVKDFTYRLPKKLGDTFKLWCQTNGLTAQQKLQDIMSEFMDGKEIVIRYHAD